MTLAVDIPKVTRALCLYLSMGETPLTLANKLSQNVIEKKELLCEIKGSRCLRQPYGLISGW